MQIEKLNIGLLLLDNNNAIFISLLLQEDLLCKLSESTDSFTCGYLTISKTKNEIITVSDGTEAVTVEKRKLMAALQ